MIQPLDPSNAERKQKKKRNLFFIQTKYILHLKIMQTALGSQEAPCGLMNHEEGKMASQDVLEVYYYGASFFATEWKIISPTSTLPGRS